MRTISESEKTTAFATIDRQIKSHPIFLYMKGSPDFPQCGFSAKVVQILKSVGVESKDLNYCNVLEHPDIRATLPEYAHWPTFPQLYINGELVGGCDIVTEMYQNNELQELLTSVQS